MKKQLAILALCAALLFPCAAPAESYSFPSAGVFLETQERWTLLCPETIDEEAALLTRLGADADALRADWAAAGTVFETYLPENIQVRLNCVETDEAAEIADASWMTDAQRAAFLDSYNHTPFENVSFSENAPGWLSMDWTLQSGDTAARFSWLVTIRQGALYCLTAASSDAGYDALRAANLSVLAQLSFLGERFTLEADGADERVALPEPVADDGRVTPIALPGFTGLSLEDTFDLTIETLPGAQLSLQTPTGSLRGAAAEDGRHTFTLSTKQTKVYAYTLTAEADGREKSSMTIEVRRELTGEARLNAYRKSASALEGLYEKIAKDPSSYKGQAVTFRGKCAEVRDLNGLPCALVYSANPGTGVWKDPVWVLLSSAEALTVDSLYTVYGDVRGDALPVPEAEDGALAPVVLCQIVK